MRCWTLIWMSEKSDKKEHCWFCSLVKTLAEWSVFSPSMSFELFTMATQRLDLFLNGHISNSTLLLNQKGDLTYFQTFLWLVSQQQHPTVLTQLSEGGCLIKCSLCQGGRKENFISLLMRALLQIESASLVYIIAQIQVLSLYYLSSLISLISVSGVIIERY